MSVPLVGAVDTAVVGHLPDPAYIGAVAFGAVIFNFLFWGFSFLRMGTTGFIAQAYGANDLTEVATTLLRALLLALLFSLLIMALQTPLRILAFWALESSENLERLSQQYYSVRVWSAPAVLANYAILGTLIGLQNTRAALILQLLLNSCNILLDLLFVFGFDWQVQGVALASVISEYIAAIAGLYYLSKQLYPHTRTSTGQWQLNPIFIGHRLQALFAVNGNIFIRTFFLTSAWFYFTATSAKFGEITLAANAILIHFQNIMAFGLDGFAFAAEALAGNAYGAAKREQLRTAVKVTSFWALVVAAIYSLVYAFAGEYLIAMLTDIEAVRSEAMIYLPWIILSPFISVWSFQLDGIFIGTTHSAEMRNGAALSLLGFLLACWLLLPLWANHGLWLALIILQILRALTLALYYPRIEHAISH